ncbi:MAG: T9SS type A sorting domain-containing protein [Bacteroidetes bacterium]|nr:T9SS type A sorting domain-containing protein [Bacteroidota bacterium]
MKKELYTKRKSEYAIGLNGLFMHMVKGLFTIILATFISSTSAITFNITTDTDWSAISNGPPTSMDIVTVKNGATLTVDVSNAVCLKLNVGAGNPSAGDGTIAFNAGSQLTVNTTGAVILGLETTNGTIDMSAGGQLLCANIKLSKGTGTLIPGIGTIAFTPNGTIFLASSFNTLNDVIIDDPRELSKVTLQANTTYNDESASLNPIFVNYQNPNPEFAVFPNPSNGSNVSLKFNSMNWEDVLVVLYNPLGELVYSEVVLQDNGSFNFALDLSDKLPQGIYLVIGSSNDQMYQQRLIVQ